MRDKININDFLISTFFFLISLAKGLGLGSNQKIYLIIFLINKIQKCHYFKNSNTIIKW